MTASLAGCSVLQEDNTVQGSIEAATAYQVESDRLVAFVDVLKPEGTDLEVTLRWEISEDYGQVNETTFHIGADAKGKRLSIRMESPTEIQLDNVTRSEVKIVRHGAPDSPWVAAPFENR
ncbi:hypothetical protein [Halorubrum distributum]|nr:hypothetical protein [Halorubrum arcis]